MLKQDVLGKRYCMCTYFSGIHILAELALNQEYANMFHNNEL